MPVTISKTEIASFVGDVLPLYLVADKDLTNADITWGIEGDAATLTRFDRDENTPFTYGVLVTLQAPGTATVKALFEGNVYTCEVRARERRTAKKGEELLYLRGDLHVHPSRTHKPDLFDEDPHIQANCISQIKNEALLDFSVLSDHACVMRSKGFFNSFVEKELAEPMEPVLFPGSESEVCITETDRMGLKHQHAGELVFLNANRCSHTKSWEALVDNMAQSPLPFGIFAHPHVLGPYGLWSFPFERLHRPELYRLMHGIELGHGSLSGVDCMFEYAYFKALDHGFAISPTCGSDCHGPEWGFHRMPAKTIVMATEKSREAILDAFLSNRFYACESGNVKLRFAINGEAAPAHLPLTDTYCFDVELSLVDDRPDTIPTHCQVISDRGEVVHTAEHFGSKFRFTLHSDTARYFYLRLWDKEGRKTWSAPIWTGREFDAPVTESNALIPLDGADFTAVDTVTGADAGMTLRGLPTDAFQSTATTARIVIDMKRTQEICALGHWGKHLSKLWIKENFPDWKAVIKDLCTETFCGHATRIAISTSVDGEHFETRFAGATSSFADEEIVRFAPCKARYVCFEVLSTVGRDSCVPALKDHPVNVGSLTIFTK